MARAAVKGSLHQNLPACSSFVENKEDNMASDQIRAVLQANLKGFIPPFPMTCQSLRRC